MVCLLDEPKVIQNFRGTQPLDGAESPVTSWYLGDDGNHELHFPPLPPGVCHELARKASPAHRKRLDTQEVL